MKIFRNVAFVLLTAAVFLSLSLSEGSGGSAADPRPQNSAFIEKGYTATYLGGSESDTGDCIAVDKQGFIYVAGSTQSKDFPTTSGAYCRENNGGRDVFISKFSPDFQTLLASTLIGGSGSEGASTIGIDDDGNVFAAGYTGSDDFPVTKSAFDGSYNGGSGDAFIVKFGSGLKTLMSSTFLGGGGNEQGWYNPILRISEDGVVYLTGVTGSTDFPTTAGAFDRDYNGGTSDVFLSKMDNSLSKLLASTYIGGNQDDDIANSIFLTKEGHVYAAGHTFSDDFPVTPGAFKITKEDWCVGFIVKLDRDLKHLEASTLFGGTNTAERETFIYCMTVDQAGHVFIGGHGFPDFPMDSGRQKKTGGERADVAYVSKLDGKLSNLLASTFLPGMAKRGGEMLFVSLAADKNGMLFGSGVTSAINFPATPGVFDETANGKSDMFVFKTDNELKSVSASTLIGGNSVEGRNKICVTKGGNIYMAGYTLSKDFPTSTGVYQNKSDKEKWDVFLLSMNRDLASGKLSQIHESAKRGDIAGVQEWISKDPALVESEDRYGRTPLHWACAYGRRETADWLVGRGARIDARDERADTPAHLAALFERKDILDLLIASGADLNGANDSSRTPLHLAALCGCLDAVETLLAHDAWIDCQDDNGDTPLYLGALNFHDHVFDYLVRKGAGLDVKNFSGKTPFHMLCGLRGRIKYVKAAAEKGADIHTRDNDNRTTLHTAVESWNKDTARFLMESGVKNNIQDYKGQTPLHYAVQKGHYFLDIIKDMIEKGADVTVKDKEGKTALDLASEGKNKEVIELLSAEEARGKQDTQASPKAIISGKIGQKGLAAPMKITILYDNYLYRQGTTADWGFSCLIEGTEKTILFDTGNRPDLLLRNADELGVDLDMVEQIVISHDHQDHIGGLPVILERNHEVSVYLPVSFPDEIVRDVETKNSRVVRVDDPLEICPNVFTTGEMGTEAKEQSLIINTEKGLVIVTGCSHQGIVEVIRRAKELFDRPVHLVFGGFHLGEKSLSEVEGIIRQFKEMGVERCGATHCTGETGVLDMFIESYGENYVPMGTGRIIEISKK